jgi:hypothetical protein
MTDKSLSDTDQPTVMFWMDRRIEELTKEELIEAVKTLGRQVNRQREDHQQTLRMWELCRKATA